eukprot:scaffold107306_cov30-Tisochrysis_lutea.AAC.7
MNGHSSAINFLLVQSATLDAKNNDVRAPHSYVGPPVHTCATSPPPPPSLSVHRLESRVILHSC